MDKQKHNEWGIKKTLISGSTFKTFVGSKPRVKNDVKLSFY
jgi:hypothetical protein